MRIRSSVIALAAVILAAVPPATAGSTAGRSLDRPGLSRLGIAERAPDGRLLGVATFGGTRPTASQVRAIERLGITVQVLRKLPLALVFGSEARLRSAVDRGLARDVYPNERLEWTSEESRHSMHADEIAVPVTGKGVGVAIVDSGIDATHPDLADHVTHNVKLVGPEYLNYTGMYVSPDTPPGTIVIPIDQGPYNNSDLGSGHGTHVSGIVAADATTSKELTGVAPDASLIGYSTGEVLFINTAVAAFDDILVHAKEWGIRVVNNSWGSSFRLFDPEHPIHVASKALHDAGIVVAFSAGNSTTEMQVNPWSVAPWVISVGSATISRERSDFSSGGLEFDNSLPEALPADRHQRWVGDRIGIYHPDVTGPGSDIVSSGTPTGAYVGPTPPGGSVAASGTSMSSPHIAGLAALLLEARPSLTPGDVRRVMQVTAAPMRDGSPFWHAGYGFVDAAAAVALVRRPDFGPALLDRLQAAADARVLADRDWRIRSTDLWGFRPLPATAFGLDFHEFEIEVTPETRAVKATVAYPTLPLLPNLIYDYAITLRDADDEVVAASTATSDAGLSSLFLDLIHPSTDEEGNPVPPPAVSFGTWTVTLEGILGSGDATEILGETLSLSVVQLAQQVRAATPGPRFVAVGETSLYFQPEGEAGPVTSPEGCAMEAGAPGGGLAPSKYTEACHAGTVGYAVNYGAGIPAEFTAAPLSAPLVVGGPSKLTLYLADAAQPAYSAAFASGITYALDAVDAAGTANGVAGGEMAKFAESGPSATRGEYDFLIPPTLVPAGSRLRLRLSFSGFYSSTMRFLYGGEYADAGLTMGVGAFVLGTKTTTPKPGPKPAPKPAPRARPLPATGVGGASWAAYALLVMAAACGAATRRAARRAG